MEPYTNVVARRVVAHLLDVVGHTALQLGVFFVLAEKGPARPDDFEDDSGAIAQITLGDERWFLEGGAAGFYVLGVLVLWFFTFVLVQGRTGRTPGKALLGLSVVRADGRPPGVARAFLRSFMWIVDGFPYFLPWLTGFVAAVASAGHQRLGDKVSETFVVDARRLRESTQPARIAGLGGE